MAASGDNAPEVRDCPAASLEVLRENSTGQRACHVSALGECGGVESRHGFACGGEATGHVPGEVGDHIGAGHKLAIGKEPTARIDERADKSYATQVYYCMSVGATRMEEAKVVEIICDE